jgi:hypothetical protein
LVRARVRVDERPLMCVCCADWLREKVYFEGLVRKDSYTIARLGFAAPNIFCMQLTS